MCQFSPGSKQGLWIFLQPGSAGENKQTMKLKPSFFVKNKTAIISLALILIILAVAAARGKNFLMESWPTFTTVFLGIFIEAIPFLLLGTLASGFVEVFVSPDFFARIQSKSAPTSALIGCFLGLLFPVCECGVVPLVRRLYQKGLPLSTGIAFLLAAPVINPIVIFSTASAFGFGSMLWMRIGFTALIAFISGLIFSSASSSDEVLQASPAVCCEIHEHHPAENGQAKAGLFGKIERIMRVAMDELFEMGRYLVFGALISAGIQTFIPQSILLSIGGGAVLSVLVMIALAVLLSICSTVDSFIALSFLGSFSTPSILAFLLYGPMVDIKSILMFTHVFKPRAVLYLLLIPLMLTIMISVSLNYFWI